MDIEIDIGLIPELYKTEAARARGEQISEFKIARLYVDSMWLNISEMLDSGVSKANVVGLIMITARIGRTAAYNVVNNKINSAANRNCKAKVKSEVSKEPGEKRKASPAAAPVSAPRPVQPVVTAKPVPRPAQAPTSASTESNQVPSKKLVLDFSKMPGANSFLGEPGYGPSQEEKELRAKAQANLDRMEREHGSPLDQARKINQQGEAK